MGWLAVCTGEFGNQGDLTLGLNLRGHSDLLLAGGLHELASLRVAYRPDLREKITVAVAIENRFSFSLGFDRDGSVCVDDGRRRGVLVGNEDH